MLFQPENTVHLKSWLIRTLEPICDAEPGALADYVLALLKHNAPEQELRKEMGLQLEEFLEKESASFLDTLFTALRTRSYLPYSSSNTPPQGPPALDSTDTGIPIPLDAIMATSDNPSPGRGRKRSIDHDDRDLRPAKGPRLSQEGQYSRYGRQDGRGTWGGRGERGGRMLPPGRSDYTDGGMNGDGEMGINGAQMVPRGYRPPNRGICRDYHNTGYCARGALCKYSHGEDAMIPAQLFPGMPGSLQSHSVPFMAMMPNGMPFNVPGANNTYDPRERMDMRPIQNNMGGRLPNPRPSIMRHGDESSLMARKPGELPVIQDLTPQVSPEERMQDVQSSAQAEILRNGLIEASRAAVDVDMAGPASLQLNGRGTHRPRGGGRGTFSGDVQSFRPERRNDKTLVVEKIPEDKLSLGAINDWFKKFGTVTNVAVDSNSAKALVSFASHDEAHAAWKSEDAVFGNRFVKVFWHRPMEGHGQLGTRMLAASAPLVEKISNPREPTTSTPPPPRKSSTPSVSSALAAKQQLLEQQIAEQKALMTKLSTASSEEKKTIMTRLRKLNEEMKPTPTPASPLPEVTPQPSSSSRRSHTPHVEEKELKERERLDKELEIHNATTTADGEGEESTEELKAKLEKLKAEAASLGLAEVSDTPYSGGSGSYRPYRARGRGARGFYRGAMRGGPPRTSMKLDNRPKSLLVKGVTSDNLETVREWYTTIGQLDSAEATDSGDIIVGFKSRAAAEQGLAKGSNIPSIGTVQVSWFTGSSTVPSSSSTKPASTKSSEVAPASSGTEYAPTPASTVPEDSHHMLDEEEPAAGWGGDDDGFGML
ncbi:RNA-binding protein 26/27 [Abortiporus biennis]